MQTELDVRVQRWKNAFQTTPEAVDVAALELFALWDHLTRRFDWSSWPAWERQATKLYGAGAAFSAGLRDSTLTSSEKNATIIQSRTFTGVQSRACRMASDL